MSKARSIGLILVLAAFAVPAAQADPNELRNLTSPNAFAVQADDPAELRHISSPKAPTAIDHIIAQERARAGDPALFSPSQVPVQVVDSREGFDLGSAGIGGAATLAMALLAAAALSLRNSNRRRTAGPASAES